MGVHLATEAPGVRGFPNLTLFPGVESGLEAILSGAAGDDLVLAGDEVFRALHGPMRPHLERVAPRALVEGLRMPELVVRAAIWDRLGTDVQAWRLKNWATEGLPLGVCTGPIAVKASSGWVLAQLAGIGCRRVFVQRGGNRNRFSEWCPNCSAAGQPARRAVMSLQQWADAQAKYDETHGEGWGRRLEQLVRLAERREARKVSA